MAMNAYAYSETTRGRRDGPGWQGGLGGMAGAAPPARRRAGTKPIRRDSRSSGVEGILARVKAHRALKRGYLAIAPCRLKLLLGSNASPGLRSST